jgi:isocitrate dehydrogenase
VVSAEIADSLKRMVRRWPIPIPNGSSLLFGVFLLLAYLPPFSDMDYGVLIRLGERIVHTGQLRPPEGFSYPLAGQDVPDFEWLCELCLWSIWNLFGYGGLKLLKVLLVGAPLLVLARHLRRQRVPPHAVGLTLLIAVAYLASGWNLRPLFLTSLGLLLVATWLHDHCTGQRSLSPWLPLVMGVWANCHPGVITGQGLLLLAVLGEWLNHYLKWNPPLSRAACWRLTALAGLGLAATFVAPQPLERLALPFRSELRHPIQRVIVEMKPLWRAIFESPYEGLPVYLLAAVLGLVVVCRLRQVRLWEVALLLGLGVLANLAIRSSQDWILLLLAVGVPQISAWLAEAVQRDRRRRWLVWCLRLDARARRLCRSPLWRWQGLWPGLLLGITAILSLTPPLGRRMPIQEADSYPQAAADWLATHTLPTPPPWNIFSRPDDAAYLIWRLGPQRVRVYADTRSFCYPPDLFADSYYVPLLAKDWPERLRRVLAQDTHYFLLPHTGDFCALGQLLEAHRAQVLYRDDRWLLLAADEVRRLLPQLLSGIKAPTGERAGLPTGLSGLMYTACRQAHGRPGKREDIPRTSMASPQFDKIAPPARGSRITLDAAGRWQVPDDPIVCLIRGDGIGRDVGDIPGITTCAVRVLDAAVEKAYGGRRRLCWFDVHAGDAARALYYPQVKDEDINKLSEEEQRRLYLPDDTLKAFEYYRVGLKGPLTTPIGGGFRSINVYLRMRFDLYACVRPVRYFRGVEAPNKRAEKVNMVIFRENTEDVYCGIEFKSGSEAARRLIDFLQRELGYTIRPTSGIGLKPISPEGSKRLVRLAIRYALDKKLPSVTLVHKGNIMKFTEGAFKEWGYEVARQEFRDRIVTEEELAQGVEGRGKLVIKDRIADSMFQQIQLRPEEYSVLATPNLNGDYLSDAAAALTGGLGLAAGANIGDEAALFEATHGTAPKYTGKNMANPGAVLLSGALLLEHLGWDEAAQLVTRGLEATLAESEEIARRGPDGRLYVTYDLARQFPGYGPEQGASSSEFAERIIYHLRRL